MSGSVSERKLRFKYFECPSPGESPNPAPGMRYMSLFVHSMLNSDQIVTIVILSRKLTLAVDTVFRST